MSGLPGEKARINAARWILRGYIVFAVLGIVLHIITRQLRGDPIVGVYIALLFVISIAALYALPRLSQSINRAMLMFAWIAIACVTGLLVHALYNENYYRNLLFMFHIGIFSVGLVLGFRSAVYCAIATSVVIVILGIIYSLQLSNDIIIPIFFAFAVALPSKVVEQLITQSTADLNAINLRLEELVKERTAELRTEILERQQAQDALYQRTIELEKQNAELDAYAHTVAHDLKSPVTSLVGFSELLAKRQTKMSEDQRAYYCNAITENAHKIASIVDALLLLARVRQIKEILVEPLDLPAMLKSIQQRLDGILTETNATILTPGVWPTVIGYQPWIEEVLFNYISNAIKYGGTPPRVAVGVEMLPNGHAKFWVRDNGKGLTHEEQARLFTPFTRLEQAKTTGYGLGLSIVQRIAEKLNARVGVESIVGQGSTFYFILPPIENK